MPLHITIEGKAFTFNPKALPISVTLKLMHALTDAFMKSKGIRSSYEPVEKTNDKAQYVCAAQLVFDNLYDIECATVLKNACIYDLRD